MRQGLRRFRPMGIADILDETFELYKSNFVLFIGIAAVLYVPYAILTQFIKQPRFSMSGSMQDISAYIGSFAIVFLYLIIVNPIIVGALTFATSDRYLDREATIGSCMRRILKKTVLWPFLGVIILKSLIIASPLIVIGIIAAIVGVSAALIHNTVVIGIGIAIGVIAFIAAIFAVVFITYRLTLVEPTFIVEMHGVGNAINRSWKLMEGNFNKAFVVLLVAGLVTSIIPGILTAPTSILVSTSALSGQEPSVIIWVINMILVSVAYTLTGPITPMVCILLYYDARIRKEGFDLELLANELDVKNRETGVTGYQQYPQEAPTQYSMEQAPQQYPQEQAPPQYPQEPKPPSDGMV